MLSPNLIDFLGAALDLRDAHVLAREARRADNRRRWRRAAQLRAGRIAAVVRGMERALGDKYVWRLKNRDGSWSVFGSNAAGEVVLLAKIGGGPRKTLEDLRAPIPITVVDPAVIDLELLRHEARST